MYILYVSFGQHIIGSSHPRQHHLLKYVVLWHFLPHFTPIYVTLRPFTSSYASLRHVTPLYVFRYIVHQIGHRRLTAVTYQLYNLFYGGIFGPI